MEDYTKYRLKAIDDLLPYLKDSDNIYVVACNKCFKELSAVEEPDCENFVQLLKEQGKNVTGSTKVDFLCNRIQTEKALEGLIPDDTENVFVVSCGLGIQTVAAMEVGKYPVFAAANSIQVKGHHGMALTEKRCDACAQCYLNITGGICPIVDCSKSLVNGQCGGAKNGKCEVNPDKDCAWEKIQKRLEEIGRIDELAKQPVQIRDYNKASHKQITEYVKEIREKRLDGYYGGVHPSEKKELAEGIALKKFPEPDEVVIPLSMHAGKPADALVKEGDYVKVGQKIGAASGFISANIHSSVSGTVIAVEPRPHSNRGDVLSVVIRSDKKDVLDDAVKPNKPLEELTPKEIVEIVQESGIVGMGGAGFPTSVKLQPNKPIEAVLLNGCECEPLLTADHRVMLEYADDVIYGLKAVMKAVSAPKGVIVVEDNKPDAIKLLEEKTAELENIEVFPVRTKYPQGAEKMLIKRVMGRQVPRGGLPADVGAVVSNISTVKAISDAIQTGMPLVERVVTVTGEKVKNPGNFVVRIGTPVKELIDYCGGLTDDDVEIKMGGPMMGMLLTDTSVPVIKGTNGIIAVQPDVSKEVTCIKCGRCVDVCPMELKPLYFNWYSDKEDWDKMQEYNVMDCIECRSCEYICSSRIPLVTKIKKGKAALRGRK
ncbi:MAG: electron transport complex subunit RsxC [Eubacterium sp.]|nr:electron transport complex subunit RsxC [Eubacterium sp.]